MEDKSNFIKTLILIGVIVITFLICDTFYKKYYFNDFEKAAHSVGITKFSRDSDITCTNKNSYKIQSNEFNDACFYKEISVTPNTPYKISCKIKTANVIDENENGDSGAQIFIVNTTEHSKVVKGTEDWQEVEFMFNSKKDSTIKIGFRLGGDEENCKGTAWFSDFKLEQGVANTEDTNWNMACFIFHNVDVQIANTNIQLSMDSKDINQMKQNMERFKEASQELSNNQMTISYDIYEIYDPIKSVTYSNEFGYYVSPSDVKDIINPYFESNEYDYVFVVVRFGDVEKNISIPTYDWIGLGGMDLNGIGYSNIRLPNSDTNYIYTYDYRINIFPEEVYVHEFLHTLERISNEAGYDRPELHSYATYGYEVKNLTGLKAWYKDYMQCKIKNENENYIGLNSEVYKLKPAHEKNFTYSIEKEFDIEEKNFIFAIFKAIKRKK